MVPINKNLENAAEKLLSTPEGKKLAGKQADIKTLADSDDGKNVQKMLKSSGFDKAVESGDINAIKNAVSGILQTQSGERLLRELGKLMEK